MAWNDPKGTGKDGGKDPWSEGGPPDLDEALRKLQKRLAGLMGARSSKGPDRGGHQPNGVFFGLILGVILIVWALSGLFVLGPAEEAVILRFGRYLETKGPGGLHWVPRFVDSPYIVNVERVATYAFNAEMLNKDENIVSVALATQFRIANPRAYLFNVVEPRKSLEQATASALRQVVGHSTLDEILTYGRAKIRADVTKQINRILGQYHTGIKVTDVAMLPARAPEQVKDAFDDAIKAQEDEQRFINQAKAYSANALPIAQGQAKQILAEAGAYQQQVILAAKGNVAAYEALLDPYKQSPAVTRQRLYLGTLENVFRHTTKVFVDSKGNNSLMYLPVDKMLTMNRKAPIIAKAIDDEPTPTKVRRLAQLDRELKRPARDQYFSRGER